MILMPAAQQPAADQVVNLPLIRRQIRAVRRSHRGDNRVVIADLRIIHKPPPQRLLARARSQMFPIGPDTVCTIRGSVPATSCERCRLSVRG